MRQRVRPASALEPAAERLLDLPPARRIVGRQQRDGLAGATHAPGAPDPMGEPFGRLGQLVVDHLANRRHIQPARRHVGSQQDRHGARTEAGHHPLARVLAQVALEGGRRITERLEPLRQLLHAVLRASKDDDRVGTAAIEQRPQRIELGLGLDVVHQVLDLGRGRRVGVHFDRDGLAHVASGDGGHPGWQCRGEQCRLAGLWSMAEDPLDVRCEATVKHLVSLVQHQE